jgi:hypothetical protein
MADLDRMERKALFALRIPDLSMTDVEKIRERLHHVERQRELIYADQFELALVEALVSVVDVDAMNGR